MEKNNNFAEINNFIVEDDKESDLVIYHNPWGEACLDLAFSKGQDLSLLSDIFLPKRYIALQHPGEYEFIFQPLHESYLDDYKGFDIVYNSKSFHAEYKKASKPFEIIARAIKRNQYEPTEYSNVFMFRSFYHDVDRDLEKDENARETTSYYPINFFVSGDYNNMNDDDISKLFRHINFYLHYYDRTSPTIVIRNINGDKAQNEYREHNICTTPKIINSHTINDTLLLLLESARETSAPRLKYIFYYQVLEYCAYYYLDSGFKQKIHNIVESPSFFSNMDFSVNTLIDEFQNNYNAKNNSDIQRLERVISTYTNYDSIKDEIKSNETYFRNECEFDGGYILPALFGKDESIDIPNSNFYRILRERIDSIRNVLVHVRESRESKCIAPTPKNSNLLQPYIYLIRRIAEELATRNF